MINRDIPSVQKILKALGASTQEQEGSRKFFVNSFLNLLRKNSLKELGIQKKSLDLNAEPLAEEISAYIKRELPEGKAAINGTGIILHTGLGRAPLSERAKKSLTIGAGYNLVQADRLHGERTIRENLIRDILKEIGKAEDTTVVNNNAAATFLMLRSLAGGKEVIISRGQLVEIGGSYRMPDIMHESGCIMKEVGTTNKTHIVDYEKAITEKTGALLYVHQSNFKIHGFSSQPSIFELLELGKKHKIPVLADLGSGALIPLNKFKIPNEPTLKEIMQAGVAACCFSGDKLIGGPQAGIICGKAKEIEKIRKDSFSRMFRVCKLTLRALEATLLDFLNENTITNIPLYGFLNTTINELSERANKIKNSLSSKYKLEVTESLAYIGGGASPDESIKSIALSFSCKNQKIAEDLSIKLRFSTPAILSRISNSQVLIDLRAIDPKDDEVLVSVFNHLEIR